MKAQSPLVFRLEPELHARLERCAKEMRVKKYTLALWAIEACVGAIEANDYSLVLPVKFEVAKIPRAREASAETRYPSHREQITRTEDKASSERSLEAARPLISKVIAKYKKGVGPESRK